MGNTELSDAERRGLRRLGELPAEDVATLGTLADNLDGLEDADLETVSDEFGLDRRDMLKALAMLGTGTIVGGLSASQIIDQVAAQASTSDADGNVGLPNDPVDVFIDGLAVGSDSALIDVPASGSVQLSSGTATVDTGLSDSSATFYLALGVDDPDADCNLAGKLFWDDSAGTYKVTIDEVDTDVGNPTANYDILRVR